VIYLLFLVFGYSIMVFGALGLVRFPDLYTRLHAATKCDTGGMIGIILGLVFLTDASLFIKAKMFLLLFLIAMINPMVSHAIARGAYKMGIKPQVKVDMYGWDNP